MAKLERDFQASLIKKLQSLFPGCLIVKLDPNYIQGIPDLLILHGRRWAVLECKKSESAARRPNQEHYIRRLDEMSFARFIYPENEQEALYDLQQAFQS